MTILKSKNKEMINIKTFICSILLGLCTVFPAGATTLDELYRDIVRSDNSGYLPMYVKNRNAPDFIFDDTELNKIEKTPPLIPIIENDTIVDFENKRKLQELEEEARRLQWQQTLNAVKENRVTPVELKEIEQRAEKDNPQAVEVLAYIYARGVGVKPDLIKAFNLYQKAEKLQVPNAIPNAAKVYKAMSPQLRKKLLSPEN